MTNLATAQRLKYLAIRLRPHSRCRSVVALAFALLALTSTSCSKDDTPLPPGAQPELVANLRAAAAAERHPSDGAGIAHLVEPRSVQAGELATWTIEFVAGDLGIAPGGAIHFQPSPFWGWSPPQIDYPDLPGYTVVRPDSVDTAVALNAAYGGPLVIVLNDGIRPGDTVLIDYGGEVGAHADRYRDGEARLWIGVDGNGDGVREWLADSPTIPVTAGAASSWQASLPATAQPGSTVTLRLAVLDAVGNRTTYAGTAQVALSDGLNGPTKVLMQDGVGDAQVVVEKDGLHFATASGEELRPAESNPMLASENFPRLLWGDLHGHTGLSDGTGTPEDYFAYARDVSGLDFAAITDHDHWGIQPLDATPTNWRRIQQSVRSAHAPPRFVALLGYEWTNWIYGHRHVVHFSDDGPLLSSLDPKHEHPKKLWDSLRGLPSLTFAHHSSGDPIPVDWSIAPDPVLEPITEVVSVHGSSEAADGVRPVGGSRSGNFVRDALNRGYQLGFIGSGDSHDGHPGLAHLASPSGGLAAVWSAANSRPSILEALRERRTYATNGPKMLLRTRLDGAEMGSMMLPSERATLRVFAVGSTPIAIIEVIADGEIVRRFNPSDKRLVSWNTDLNTSQADYVYVRVAQEGYGVAWSSPYFFEAN